MATTGEATQKQYNALYKPNQLIYGEGQIAVITGWTVKETVAKRLNNQDYAVIGQLYSPTRGINLLIRNLLYNTHIRYLIILDATKEDKNAGSCRCLADFFEHGFEQGVTDTEKPSWLINSPVQGYIDIEIDKADLNKIRKSLHWKVVSSIKETVELVKDWSVREYQEQWNEQKEYPMQTVESNILPGRRYGHRIEGKTIAQTWVKIIHLIKSTGTIRPTAYDGKWQELINLMAIVTEEPDDFNFPEPNYLPISRSFLQEYISQILDDAPLSEGVKYTYGQRLRSFGVNPEKSSNFNIDQVEQVINRLVADINSARAVMSLWDVTQDGSSGSPPCLNHIWVRIVNHELSLTATFRSNDMFSAWCANAMGLLALQKHILKEINQRSGHNLKRGPLITISQSAHIYDDCWENAQNIIQTYYPQIYQQRNYSDPVGSFVININNYDITIEHMTPGSGEVVNCYSGKHAKNLYRQIAADCPGIETGHAMYLGNELQKAEIALNHKFIYQQDKPLKHYE
ncbi:MAG: thymidylate synthase [Cyanobacteria bacterium P01_A01_bin.45]